MLEKMPGTTKSKKAGQYDGNPDKPEACGLENNDILSQLEEFDRKIKDLKMEEQAGPKKQGFFQKVFKIRDDKRKDQSQFGFSSDDEPANKLSASPEQKQAAGSIKPVGNEKNADLNIKQQNSVPPLTPSLEPPVPDLNLNINDELNEIEGFLTKYMDHDVEQFKRDIHKVATGKELKQAEPAVPAKVELPPAPAMDISRQTPNEESKIAKKLKDLDEQETYLEKKKEQIEKHILSLGKKEGEINEKAKNLKREKEDLELQKKEYKALAAEISRTKKELEGKEKQIKDEEESLKRFSDENQKTLADLEEREKEILESVASFEKDKAMLDEKAEGLEKKAKDFIAREMNIKKSESRLSKLEKDLASKERRLKLQESKVKNQIMKKTELKKLEALYIRAKKRVNAEYAKLEDILQRRKEMGLDIIDSESGTKEDGPSTNRAAHFSREDGFSPKISLPDTVSDLIDDANTAIAREDLASAIRAIAHLRERYDRLDGSKEVKRRIHYSILELENDLGLKEM